VLFGLLTRFAVVPLIAIMVVALASTKWPILRDEGFWQAAHDARTDWAMLLGSLFLLIVGPGECSLDRVISKRRLP
jgi:putative oxidoreductase